MRNKDPGGFTLVELLIVVIILGILAAVVIPTFQSSADETNESTLMSNLVILRGAIEHYHIQHGGTWPGTIGSTTNWNSFVIQMTTMTDEDGNSGTQYGPYLRVGVPRNPINNLSTGTVGTIPSTADGSTGWYYDATTGEIRANAPGTGPTTGFLYIDM